jgi:gliding motility-associated-like protein
MNNHFFRKAIIFLSLSLILSIVIGSTLSSINSRFSPLSNLFNQADPVPEFDFVPDNTCANQAISFTDKTTGTGPFTYEWDFGDGQKSTVQNPTHSFSSAVGGGARPFMVKLTVKAADGKTATKTKVVTVKEIPSLNVTSEQAITNFGDLKYFIVCENKGSEFTFFNAPASTEKNALYEINWGDGSPGFSGATWNTLKHTYAVGIYTLTYMVTPENGCKVSKTYRIFIGSNPAVGLGNPGNTNVCVGETLTFPITGTTNNPLGTTYTVTFSDGSTPQKFNHPAPPSVSHVFTKPSCGIEADGFPNSFSVKIVAENPCARSQASVFPIYVSEPAKPTIKIDPAPVCAGSEVIVENTTIFATEVSNNGTCSNEGKSVWEISPTTGWTLTESLGSRPNPTSPNSWISGNKIIRPRFTTPGTYTIKLITGNRCGIRDEIKTVTVIPTPAPTFSFDKIEACGETTLKATNTSNTIGVAGVVNNWSVSYTKGSCGTTSNWAFASGSATNSESPTFIFKNPGIYTVMLTIQASCGTYQKVQEVTITAPPTITFADIPNSCGPVTITPKATVNSCGSIPPTYKWTFGGGTPASATSLDPGPVTFSAPGVKKIILEVISSCGITVSERSFTISSPPIPSAGVDLEICNGEERVLEGSATSGSGTYSYQWTSSPSTPIVGSNTAKPTVTPNQSTILTLTVTDLDTQCKATDQIEIKVNPAPIVVFDLPNQVICSGEITQPVTLSSTPAGESITWTAAPNGVIGITGSGTNVIPAQKLINKTGKPIEVIYTALIPNSSLGSCNVVPAKHIITVNPEPDYLNDIIETCSGQPFSFRPENLVTGSTFTWTFNAPVGIVGATNVTVAQSSINQILQNTSDTPLEVIYTINPALGLCPGKPFELKVTVQPSPSIILSEPDQSLCTGGSSKAVNLTSPVVGASFSWTAIYNGVTGGTPSGSGNQIPTQTLINPTNQPIVVEYRVTVSTASGGRCAGIPKTYKITVNPTLVLNPDISAFNGFGISCFGSNDGFIKLNPNGGGGDFEYSWTGPNGFTSTQKAISALAPGTYEVSVSDDFGCAATRSFQLTEPPLLSASITATQSILCAGDESGRIELEVVGGVGPYAYQWKRNGTIFNRNQKDLLNIPAGNYEVQITDANGCSETISDIELTEPALALVINFTKTDITCYNANDGSLDLQVAGGAPPYTISWTFGADQSSFDNLGPGDYTLIVSDQSGCSRTQTITIEAAPVFEILPDVRQISCFGENEGSIKLNLSGGVGQTTIRWDGGEQLANLFNLSAGFYGVTIKDQTDCEIRSEFNIVEPALLVIEPKLTDALACDNPQSGEIRLGISGGTPPYSIKWSNGSTSENLLNISSGQYAVTITDASGCLTSGSFTIKRPPPLVITGFRSTNVQCEPREISKQFRITVSGGVAPYTINWSGGNISTDGKTMTTANPGLYQVTVTDGMGCQIIESFEVKNLELIPEAAIESAAFEQYKSYLVNFEIQFLNKSFGQITSYFWEFGDGTTSFEENPKHTYSAEGNYEISLTITDIFGCSALVKKEVKVFDYYLVMPNVFTPNSDGTNDFIFPRFINIASLQFWVLNKWGETIYYTDDLDAKGWDGTINGGYGTPGNYVYKLKFKTFDGRTQTKTDLFLLLK